METPELNAQIDAMLTNVAPLAEPEKYTPEDAQALGMRVNDIDGDGLTTSGESNWYLSPEEYQAYRSAQTDSVAVGLESKNAEAKDQAALAAQDSQDSLAHDWPAGVPLL